MSDDTVTTGQCYCGAVKLECKGEPMNVVCHCLDCARWTGSVNLASLYPCDAVTVTGELKEFSKELPDGKENPSKRRCCAKCNGAVLNDHPSMNLTDVVSGVLSREFKPLFHIFYEKKIWGVKDGLPKFKDMPADMGGSGDTMDE
jgi:hypothetical protein